MKKGDIIGKTDPYVLVNLLGGNIKECKTKVVKNNANPVWEESIRFMANEAHGKVLLLQIFDKDMLKDDPIGEVVIIKSINQISNCCPEGSSSHNKFRSQPRVALPGEILRQGGLAFQTPGIPGQTAQQLQVVLRGEEEGEVTARSSVYQVSPAVQRQCPQCHHPGV